MQCRFQQIEILVGQNQPHGLDAGFIGGISHGDFKQAGILICQLKFLNQLDELRPSLQRRQHFRDGCFDLRFVTDVAIGQTAQRFEGNGDALRQDCCIERDVIGVGVGACRKKHQRQECRMANDECPNTKHRPVPIFW